MERVPRLGARQFGKQHAHAAPARLLGAVEEPDLDKVRMDRPDAPGGAGLPPLVVGPRDAQERQAVHLRDVGGAELERLLHSCVAGVVRIGGVLRPAQGALGEAERSEGVLADDLTLRDEAAKRGEEELQVDVDGLGMHGRGQQLRARALDRRAIGEGDRAGWGSRERGAQRLGRLDDGAEIPGLRCVPVDGGLRPCGREHLQPLLERGGVASGDGAGGRIPDQSPEQAQRDGGLLGVGGPPALALGVLGEEAGPGRARLALLGDHRRAGPTLIGEHGGTGSPHPVVGQDGVRLGGHACRHPQEGAVPVLRLRRRPVAAPQGRLGVGADLLEGVPHQHPAPVVGPVHSIVQRLGFRLLLGVVVGERVGVVVFWAEQVLALAARDDGAEQLAQDLHQLGVCGLDRLLRGHRDGFGEPLHGGGGASGETPRDRPVACPQGDPEMAATNPACQHQRQARPPVEPRPPCQKMNPAAHARALALGGRRCRTQVRQFRPPLDRRPGSPGSAKSLLRLGGGDGIRTHETGYPRLTV